MFELEINGKMYPFKFGIGFLREINKTRIINEEEAGFKVEVFNMTNDHDPTCLYDVLMAANKGQNPRISAKELEEYIEKQEELGELIDRVIDFLEKNSCTKKLMENVQGMIKNSQN